MNELLNEWMGNGRMRKFFQSMIFCKVAKDCRSLCNKPDLVENPQGEERGEDLERGRGYSNNRTTSQAYNPQDPEEQLQAASFLAAAGLDLDARQALGNRWSSRWSRQTTCQLRRCPSRGQRKQRFRCRFCPKRYRKYWN